MKTAKKFREAATVLDGRKLPEEEVVRGGPETGGVFQAREAVTVRQGRRRRSGEEISKPCFQVREAVTTILPPPHWANLPPAPPEEDAAPVAQASPPAVLEPEIEPAPMSQPAGPEEE